MTFIPGNTAERYMNATEASNLRVQSGANSSADLVIAAGWLGPHLGALLLRLQGEYDGVRGAHGIADVEFERAERAACALELEEFTPPRGDHAAHVADRARLHNSVKAHKMREDAAAQALTSRALVLVHLKSLRGARDMLQQVALQRSEAWGYGFDVRTVAGVVGQALDLFLDPSCHKCQGRGYSGGYGTIKIRCRACEGVGKRRESRELGKDALQRQFGRSLLNVMEELVRDAERQIRARTKSTSST